MIRNLEKHEKYQMHYKPNDIFWGLGIEHETFLESNKLKQITIKELKENKSAERYSVAHYEVYDTELWNKTIDDLFSGDSKILLPILANSHTFENTDRQGEHPTTQERIPKPNPKFQGINIIDWMKTENPDEFEEEHNYTFSFDGEFIEFVTQYFYKSTIKETLQELLSIQKNFMRSLNSLPREGIFKQYGPFQIPSQNYPFVSYLTNLKNNAMFNNSVIQLNITLPTKLDNNGKIQNRELFTKQHQSYARVIQLCSPLLIAIYGSPDPLSESKQFGHHYAAGSQRIAVSRYVGLGTFDTDTMESGTILFKKKEELSHIEWYESFYKKTNYKCLNTLGMDLNFNKHTNHGLEIRILDAMPLQKLEEVTEFLIHLADFSLENSVSNPIQSNIWHHIAEQCVHLGKGYQMDVSDQHELFQLLGINHLSKEPLMIQEIYNIIKSHLYKKYHYQGICSKCFILGEDYQESQVER
jgi:hypothetical protein